MLAFLSSLKNEQIAEHPSGNSIRLARTDERAGGNFVRAPRSQLTASGFVFPGTVSCEIARPIRVAVLGLPGKSSCRGNSA